VATLVARGQPPTAIFNAVTEELGKLVQATGAMMVRFEADGSTTVIARWGTSAADHRPSPHPASSTASAGVR
jgi:hypothetical protein